MKIFRGLRGCLESGSSRATLLFKNRPPSQSAAMLAVDPLVVGQTLTSGPFLRGLACTLDALFSKESSDRGTL